MRIDYRVIPHKDQRYPTVGDWFYAPDGTLHIRVSAMSDPRYQWLVFMHELIEAQLCEQDQIAEDDVTAWDVVYEQCRENGTRPPCGCPIQDEPGNDIHAPYWENHRVATIVEQILAAELGIDWYAYDAEVEGLE